jgi:predicted transcriptional regulator
MEVHFSPEPEEKLMDSEAVQGRNTDELLEDALTRYLAEEARFVEGVRRGEAELRRGEYLTHEQVSLRLERFLKP